MYRLTLLALLTTSFTVTSFANIINVPLDQPTIQTGLDATAEGDTVMVASGTYFENIWWPEVNGITLIGSGEEECIIDGNQSGEVIFLFGYELDLTALINGFTIKNGGGVGGRGIACSYFSLSLVNVIISDNSGGGIWCVGSNLNLDNVTINGNSAEYGGGISCFSSSLSLENVTISSNSADYGGGIYCMEQSDLNLEHVTICDNSAEQGGGIFCRDSTRIVDVTIRNNIATLYGGGIYCRQNSSTSIENVTISDNSACLHGGGVYCCPSTLNFSAENRCSIYSNTISNSRGYGADIFSTAYDIIDVIVDTFTVMTPTDYHASPISVFTFDILNGIEDLINADVYVAANGDDGNDGTSPDSPFKTISHALSRIADNNTIHLAAGVYSPSTTGELFPVHWSNSVNLSGSDEADTILDAENTAGVLEFCYVSDATLENLVITNGSADYGGGVYCQDSNPSLENVTIINNTAGGYDSNRGGGIYCRGSNPRLANVTITGNSADNGGGICCYYNSSPNLESVTIADNSASIRGGGIYCHYSTPFLVNVTITGNSASDNGGGVYCSQDSSPCLMNCILENDSPQEIYFYGSFGWNSITIACSDIEGGEAGIETNGNGEVYWLGNNIDADPLFCDPENGDYRLQLNSPCRLCP